MEEWDAATVALFLRSVGFGHVPGLKGITGSELARVTADDLLLLGVPDAALQQSIVATRDAFLSNMSQQCVQRWQEGGSRE